MKEMFMIQVIDIHVDAAYDVHVEAHIFAGSLHELQESKRYFPESINEIS